MSPGTAASAAYAVLLPTTASISTNASEDISRGVMKRNGLGVMRIGLLVRG